MSQAQATDVVARPASLPLWVFRGRVPSLDGVRAVAITLVILQHAVPSIGLRRGMRHIPFLFNAGHFGVTLFFVLSGFLITLLLLRERDSEGCISLRNFYVRRILRLFPAYAVYLAVMAILACTGQIQIPGRAWVAAMTYTTCFTPHLGGVWQVAHTWSLSVEENFYLLWPFLLIALKPKRAFILIAFYVAAAPALRYCIWRRFGNTVEGDFYINQCSLTEMSSIAVGCILAAFVHFGRNSRYLAVLQRHPGQAFAVAMLGLGISVAMTHLSSRFAVIFTDPVVAVFDAVAIAGLLFMGRNPLTLFLNARPIVFLGVLSYSLYLWQEPFTYVSPFWACRWPINVVLALAVACVSYAFIERPFLRIKGRFAPRIPAAAPPRAQVVPQAVA
jgi:peptidoglycan/LPS O-acetylase OafA/YrhL